MTLIEIREILLWCTLINFGVLLWWLFFITLAHDWTYKVHSQFFQITLHRFDSMHYAGMMAYKLAIILFNLVPYFAIGLVAE